MAHTKPPGVIRHELRESINDGTSTRSVSSRPGASSGHDSVHHAQVDLLLDLSQMALDFAGIFDPTPACDGASALLSLGRGQWLDAVLSGISIVPYVGDLAKAGKLPKYLRSIEKIVAMAERSAKFARQVLPGMEKLLKLLDLIPAHSNQMIDAIRARVAHFVLSNRGVKAAAHMLPDISRRFAFKQPSRVMHGGKPYILREAEGILGVPGKVKTHGIPSSVQKQVSRGSGDDAGHLIGKQFGAPSGGENLSRQNWVQNQGGGTWHDMEAQWAEKLKHGTGVKVKVKEYTPEGHTRPLWREAEWTETARDGTVTRHTSPQFLNTHTADAPHRAGSRTQQQVPPTVSHPQKDNVLPFRRP